MIFKQSHHSFFNIRLCSTWTNDWYVKESSKITPIRLSDNNNLKLYNNVYNIKLRYDYEITERLKCLKGVHTIDLTLCDQITDGGLKYLKSVGVHTIDLISLII